jgi:hypothetical protein
VRELVDQETRIAGLEEKMLEITGKLDEFKGLPSGKREAIRVVKELEEEVARLAQNVDSTFEALVEK